MIRLPKNNSLRNFPADMFVLSGVPLIAPLVLSICMFEYARITVVLALGVACIGAALLFWAKLPLYRAGIYFSFGPAAIPASHRPYYYWGIGLALCGCVQAAVEIPLLSL